MSFSTKIPSKILNQFHLFNQVNISKTSCFYGAQLNGRHETQLLGSTVVTGGSTVGTGGGTLMDERG